MVRKKRTSPVATEGTAAVQNVAEQKRSVGPDYIGKYDAPDPLLDVFESEAIAKMEVAGGAQAIDIQEILKLIRLIRILRVLGASDYVQCFTCRLGFENRA